MTTPSSERLGPRPIAIAVGAVGVASGLSYLLAPHTFSSHYVAVLVATTYGNTRAGILTLSLSSLVVGYVFVPPSYAFVVSRESVISMTLFLVVSGALLFLGDRLRARTRTARETAGELSDLVASAMDAIVTVDQAGRVVVFNAAAEKMFRRPRATVEGRGVELLLPRALRSEGNGAQTSEPDTEDAWTGLARGAVSTVRGIREGGEEFPLEVSVSAAKPDAVTTLVLRDISKRLAALREIERLQRLYAALSQVNQAIVWMPTRTELFQKICEVLVEFGRLRLAWIAWLDPETQELVPIVRHGDAQRQIPTVRVEDDGSPSSRGPSAQAFREGTPYICNDLLADPNADAWREGVARSTIRASAAFPLRLRDQVVGTLGVCADEVGFFREQEVALLVEAAMDVSFAMSTLADKEERLRAEEAAAAERSFSETLIESTPGALYMYDDQGRFLRWNQTFAEVTGYSAEEIRRMHPRDFFPPNEVELLERRVAEVFATGKSTMEGTFLAKDGTQRPYFFTGQRVEHEGRPCLVGVGMDITEQKRAEAAVRELAESLERKVVERTRDLDAARARAESADKLKSSFLATMSHELRTPMNSIIGFTGIMLQGLAGPLTEEQTKQLGMVRGSARHLLELINDVLDISKIEAERLEIHPEPFDLCAAVERTAGLVTPLALRKGLRLDTRLPTTVPPMVSDRRRVDQILLNLLNNALKFTDTGAVTLTLEYVEDLVASAESPPAPGVRIQVVDTGIGMDEADVATLFQPFKQLDSGLARKHEGTGLGLAICRRLTVLLGGDIRVTSAPGRGSTFTVTLPLVRRSDAP
ncbi:MAG: PAS domain S-box protein [Polyangiaceae bacterium]|nr:PAS domain S-box protein [Polyangiaceae bacterium]